MNRVTCLTIVKLWHAAVAQNEIAFKVFPSSLSLSDLWAQDDTVLGLFLFCYDVGLAVIALCEKKLAEFLRNFLAKQPNVKAVPVISFAYK